MQVVLISNVKASIFLFRVVLVNKIQLPYKVQGGEK